MLNFSVFHIFKRIEDSWKNNNIVQIKLVDKKIKRGGLS